MDKTTLLTVTLKRELQGISNHLKALKENSGMTAEQFAALLTLINATFSASFKGEPFVYDDLTPEQKVEITPKKGVDYFNEADLKVLAEKTLRLISSSKDFMTEKNVNELTDLVLSKITVPKGFTLNDRESIVKDLKKFIPKGIKKTFSAGEKKGLIEDVVSVVEKKIKAVDTSKFVIGVGTRKLTVSNNAPENPGEGDLWVDTK